MATEPAVAVPNGDVTQVVATIRSALAEQDASVDTLRQALSAVRRLRARSAATGSPEPPAIQGLGGTSSGPLPIIAWRVRSQRPRR